MVLRHGGGPMYQVQRRNEKSRNEIESLLRSRTPLSVAREVDGGFEAERRTEHIARRCQRGHISRSEAARRIREVQDKF